MRLVLVSVPLRGNGYKERGRSHINNDRIRLTAVSVPLRGNGYKERKNIMYYVIKDNIVFPSPCGEMGIRNGEIVGAYHRNLLRDAFVSVPLRGNGYKERATRADDLFRQL